MEFVLCTSMFKMFICNINCAILTFFLILIFISFRAIPLQILLVLKQGVFQDKMLILTTFRNSGSGGGRRPSRSSVRRYVIGHRKYYLRPFLEKLPRILFLGSLNSVRFVPQNFMNRNFGLLNG